MDYLGEILNNRAAIFALIIAGIAAVGLFIWFFWDKLSTKWKGAAKIPAVIIKEEPRFEEQKLLIDQTRYVVNPQERKGWFLHPLAVQRTPDGNIAGMLLTDDSCIPQFPGLEIDIESICASIDKAAPFMALYRCLQAIEKQRRANQNDSIAEWMGLAAMLAVGGGVLIVGVALVLAKVNS